MEQIILAFEQEKTARRIKELLESSGTAACLLCTSADQVRRMVCKRRITTVVCGYKLRDQSAQLLAEDLPPFCSVLVLAPQNLLELLENVELFRLPTLVTRRDLLTTVEMLLRMGHRLERILAPRRPTEEQQLVDRAKHLLMDRNGMTEEQAHRFLQKNSMDHGVRMSQTAQLVLDSEDLE